jgi:hypothetical protein
VFEQLVAPNRTLLLRDPFGRLDFVRLAGSLQWKQPLAAPSSWDQARGFPTRHYHEVDVQFISVARPRVLDPAPIILAT